MYRFLSGFFVFTVCFAIQRSKAQDSQEQFAKLKIVYQQNDDLLERIIKLASNQPLLQELEIVGDQSTKLRQFAIDHVRSIRRLKSQSFQLQVKELSGNLSEIEKQRLSAEKKNNIRQLVEATNKSIKNLDNILLAHQIKRLKQISLQQQKIESNKFADEFGISLELENELALSSDEKKDLEKKIELIRKEYYAKAIRLRQETVKKVLNELKSNQKTKYIDLIGDHYDFDAARREAIRKANKKQL